MPAGGRTGTFASRHRRTCTSWSRCSLRADCSVCAEMATSTAAQWLSVWCSCTDLPETTDSVCLQAHTVCAGTRGFAECTVCLVPEGRPALRVVSCHPLSHHPHSITVPSPSVLQGLINSHLSRLQQDLFHELKKVRKCEGDVPLLTLPLCITPSTQSGSARSLAVAVEVFAKLYPLTRPSRCQALSQNLFPVLLRLLAREEEVLHDTLKEALSLILPTMTPFVTTSNMQVRGHSHLY